MIKPSRAIGHLVILIVFSSWCVALKPSHADETAIPPSIETVRPIALMQGSVAEITLVGSGLSKTAEVLFYQPGLRCNAINAVDDEKLTLEVEASKECPQGLHAIRVRSPYGLSELRTICVTRYPVVIEASQDNKSNLQRLEENTTVAGTLSGDTADRYAIRLDKGARLSVEIESIRLGIGLLDTTIRVIAPDEHVVAMSDDTAVFRQDPALSFVTDVAGDFTIEVRESGSSRADGSPYLLHVGNYRRPQLVFPLGGRVGQSIKVEWDRGSDHSFTQIVELPSARSNNFPLIPSFDGIDAPTPIPFRVSDFDDFTEVEPNDELKALSRPDRSLQLPIGINGTIAQPGDQDCYWINASKGQSIDIEVYASRYGSSVDSVISVFDESMLRIARNDDLESHDSRLSITPEQDGALGIVIEDKLGRGGPDFAYRIEVTPSTPSIDVFLPRRDRLSQAKQAIDIPRGNRVLALLGVRKSTVDGSVNVQFPSLPSGVRAIYQTPNANDFVMPVVFEASGASSIGGALVPIDATLTTDNGQSKGAFRQVVDLVRGPADAIYRELVIDKLSLAVIEPQPFSIDVAQPTTTLPCDGTLDIQVTVTRQPGFNGAIEVAVPWLPPWVDADANVIIPANETKASIKLRAWKQASTGSWPFVLEATAYAGRTKSQSELMIGAASLDPAQAVPMKLAVASLPVRLDIGPAPVQGVVPVAAGEQGSTIAMECKLEGRNQLSGDWTATLEGLPNRIVCDPIVVAESDQSVAFTIKTDPTAPIGNFIGLACRLTGTIDGQLVSYVIGRQGKLTITKPGEIARDSDGRPLTRLEAIRKRTGEKQ